MINQTFLAIEKPKLDKIAIKKIDERTHLKGKTIIYPFLHKSLDSNLSRSLICTQCRVTAKQVIFLTEDIDRLARGVFVVFVSKVREIVEIVVRKSTIKGDDTTAPDD